MNTIYSMTVNNVIVISISLTYPTRNDFHTLLDDASTKIPVSRRKKGTNSHTVNYITDWEAFRISTMNQKWVYSWYMYFFLRLTWPNDPYTRLTRKRISESRVHQQPTGAIVSSTGPYRHLCVLSPTCY